MKNTLSLLLSLSLLFASPVRAQWAAVLAGRPPVAGGGTSPGTGSILAWYDFADATDADGGTLNLTEVNGPTYTAGPPSFGSATGGAADAHWTQGTLDNTFCATDSDWSMVFRFRANSGIANGNVVFDSNGGRARITYSTTAINGRLGTSTETSTSGVAGSEGPWFTVVLSHNGTTDVTSISVNGETFTSGSVTPSYNTGTAFFGAASGTLGRPVDVDFAGFWNKTLSQDNVTWLYNAAGTRLYSEL